MKIMVISALSLALAACSDGHGRYQLVANPSGGWMRLDTKTGEMAACGPETFANPPKFYCIKFPDTVATK